MKNNVQIYLLSILLVLGSVFNACGPDARLDMIGTISGTSPRIDQRLADSEKYNAAHPFVTLKASDET